MTNRGSLQNSDSSVRPKKMFTRRGQSLVQTGQIHTGKGDKGDKEELFWKAIEQIIFQRFCFSVEKSKRHHQLQDTIPQHCGESTTEFYCRFEKIPFTALHIREDDVHKVFRMNNRRKAPGPDGVTLVCLKSWAD